MANQPAVIANANTHHFLTVDAISNNHSLQAHKITFDYKNSYSAM